MWTAYWQADGDMRYEIATVNREHTAAFERDEFIKRMSHPEVGVWFTWLESDAGVTTLTMNYVEWLVRGDLLEVQQESSRDVRGRYVR